MSEFCIEISQGFFEPFESVWSEIKERFLKCSYYAQELGSKTKKLLSGKN
jgi:hypothetical protein